MKLTRCMHLSVIALVTTYLFGAIPVQAEEASEKILEPLKQARPDFRFEPLQKTPVNGMYRTTVVGGPTIYISEDGKHFFTGDVFFVGENGITNIAEQELEGDRKAAIEALKTDDMIVFSPSETKAYVYVFTDVDCYYCQKLHKEVPALKDLGVEVRYLAYPRAGVGSPAFRKMASAWCADDPQDALTRLKLGKDIPDNVCDGNPVTDQYKLGGRLGVTGTPALITAEGELIPGYLPADKLAKRLGL
jgi:thiol:disulfide interchange protein DsbC